MALKIKTKRRLRDYLATILGAAVAIAMALTTVDWANFDISKEWPKLVLDAIIACGGYFSTIKPLVNKKNGPTEG